MTIAEQRRMPKGKNPFPPKVAASSLVDMGRIIRPQARDRWLMPSVAAITPQYIENTLRGALAGSHVQAWELFDLMEDTWPRLRKNALELKNAVRGLKRTFLAYQEEDEEATSGAEEKKCLVSAALRGMSPRADVDENGLDGTIFDILDAWFKGQSLLEVEWEVRRSKKLGDMIAPRATTWVHPSCFAWGNDGVLGLTTGTARQTGWEPMPGNLARLPENKFIVAVCKTKTGSVLGGALLRPLAWWWCAANFSADWLLNFAQIFGLPFRWANYSANAPQATVETICNMLQNMGSAGWAAFPEGTALELKEASKTGADTPQADMLDRADKQCDLLVLGQTLTTDTGGSGAGGGSLALGKVHAGVRGEVIAAAADFVEDVIEKQFIPAILTLNYGNTDECPCMELSADKEEDLEVKSRVIQNLTAAGAGKVIGLDWLGKQFGIPKPGDDEETLSGNAKFGMGDAEFKKPGDLPPSREDAKEEKGEKEPKEPALPVKSKAAEPTAPDLAEEFLAEARKADPLAGPVAVLERIAEIKDDAAFSKALEDFSKTL